MNLKSIAYGGAIFVVAFFLSQGAFGQSEHEHAGHEHGGKVVVEKEHAGHEHGGQALGEKERKIVLHPPLVHFPIAFYFLEFVLLLFWIAKKDEAFRRFALFSFRIGYLFMIAAVISGYRDAGGLENITGAVRAHALAAVSVFILYTGRAFHWRFAKQEQKNYRLILLVLAFFGNVLVMLTGFLGGELVYG